MSVCTDWGQMCCLTRISSSLEVLVIYKWKVLASEMECFLKVSVFLQIVLAAEACLAGGLLL